MRKYLSMTIKEAVKGSSKGDGGPFGALILKNGKVIAKAHNTVLKTNDPTCHAEVNAIRQACKKLKSPHLDDCILIASSEPCPMCLTTAYWAEIKTIHYALPRKVAAAVGFTDDFIYRDLKKLPAKRLVKVIHARGLENRGKKIFKNWAKGGKLY